MIFTTNATGIIVIVMIISSSSALISSFSFIDKIKIYNRYWDIFFINTYNSLSPINNWLSKKQSGAPHKPKTN